MPTRQELETALTNADAAGDEQAARTLALALKNGEYDQPQSALNVTPMQPAPETPPNSTLLPNELGVTVPIDTQRQVNQNIDETQRIEGRAMGRDLRNEGSPMEVRRDPQTGEPFQAMPPGDPMVAGPAASYENLQDSSELANSAALFNGNTLGAGGEIAGLMNFDIPQAKQGFDDAYAKAYEDNPALAMALEMGGSVGPLMLGGAAGMGPRTAGTLEGAAYGFNDPIAGGEGLGSRAVNAVGGGIAGNMLSGIGKSAARQAERSSNQWSGIDTIQKVADEEFDITLTEGQIRQNTDAQAFERDARKGSKGRDANEIAVQAFEKQEQATIDAGRALGGNNFATSNEAGGEFLRGAQDRVRTQQSAVDEAYSRARGFNAELNAQGARSMPDAVTSGLDNELLQQLEIDPEGFKGMHPNTAIAMQSVASLGAVGQQRGGLPFEQLENVRRTINTAISASGANPADRRAAMQLKGSFDKFIDTAVDEKLFSGDEAFISAYREARGLRSEFATDWEANKVFDRLIKADATPEMALNFVLGGGRLAGDKQMVVLRQLKTALRDDPEAIAALQEAYMKKILRQTEKTFSPKVLRDNLDELLIGKNESFASELLDGDQYQQLRKFRSVVDSMIPMDGTNNTSNTAAALERTKGAVTDFLTGPMRSGPVRATGRVVNEMLGKFIVRTGGSRARNSFSPPRGLDTRRIEEGFPVPEAQLPGRQPRTLQQGVEGVANQPAPDPVAPGPTPAPQRPTFGKRQPEVDPIAEAMIDQGDDPVSNGIPRLFSGKKLTNTDPATKTVAEMFKEGFTVEDIADELNFTTEGVEKHLKTALRYGFDIGQNSRAGPRPASNGLPLRGKPGRSAQPVNTGEPARKVKMQFKDGRPTVIGKVYEFASSVNPETGARYTSAEIADEMAMSNNQVAVTLNRLRANGFDVDVPASASPTGANGEKRAMAVELKRQGLGEAEILSRINAVYGKDAVHGGTDMTNNSLRSILSKSRRRLRESGDVVDFGVGVMPLGAAAGMNALPRDEQSIPEHMLNESGTIDEQLLRAMMGGM